MLTWASICHYISNRRASLLNVDVFASLRAVLQTRCTSCPKIYVPVVTSENKCWKTCCCRIAVYGIAYQHDKFSGYQILSHPLVALTRNIISNQTQRKKYLSLHTNKCTSIIYYLKSVLIIKIKTLYSLIAPTCFDTTRVIIREHSFFLAKITG
jgi:hypothetical protein